VLLRKEGGRQKKRKGGRLHSASYLAGANLWGKKGGNRWDDVSLGQKTKEKKKRKAIFSCGGSPTRKGK